MVIDGIIPKNSVNEDGEALSLKKNDDDGNFSQSNDVGRQSPENKINPITSRREIRST